LSLFLFFYNIHSNPKGLRFKEVDYNLINWEHHPPPDLPASGGGGQAYFIIGRSDSLGTEDSGRTSESLQIFNSENFIFDELE
jgi:hypothetical protein